MYTDEGRTRPPDTYNEDDLYRDHNIVPLYPGCFMSLNTGTMYEANEGLIVPREEVKIDIIKDQLTFMVRFPDPSMTGPVMLGMLNELGSFDKPHTLAREDLLHDYPDLDSEPLRNIVKNFLRYHLNLWGLATDLELETGLRGELAIDHERRNAIGKFLTYEMLKKRTDEWHAQGLRIGMIHGAFDPPTISHYQLAAKMRRPTAENIVPCDILLSGIDSNVLLQSLKGTSGDLRPRYPQVYGRLWMLLSSPYIDAGLILPIAPADGSLDDQFLAMYKDLHITALGTSAGHRSEKVYRADMESLWGSNGHVYTFDDEYRRLSSTYIHNAHLSADGMFGIDDARSMLDSVDAEARRAWKIK